MTHYAPEFIATGLKLSDELGTKKAAEVLGISHRTIDRWRRVRKADKAPNAAPYSVG